jgi:hypothetical protein
MEFRVAPHVLRAHGEYVVGTVDGKSVLVVPANEEIAAELCAAHPTEAVPVTVSDIEEICKDRGLVVVGFYGLEGPDELTMFSVETLPLFLEEAR